MRYCRVCLYQLVATSGLELSQETIGAVDAIMVDVQLSCLAQIAHGLLALAHTGIAQGKHVEAVDAVLLIQIGVPHEQVGQRYGKVVHGDRIEDMLLAIVDEFVEEPLGFILIAQLAITKRRIENLVGLGIVVVHGSSRLGRPYSAELPMLACLVALSQQFVGQSEVVVEVIVLRPLQFA